MNRIVIDVSKAELDYLREALQHKHINMMSYLDFCAEQSTPSEMDADQIFEDDFPQETTAPKKPFKYKKAPYGLKKDGTPKQRPGRKVVEF